MNHGACWKLGCVLLLLCSACGDDDQGTADPAATRDESDGGSRGDPASSGDGEQPAADDDEPVSTRDAGGDMPSEGGAGSGPGSDPAMNDAATPPAETMDAGDTEPPGGDAAAEDAAVSVTDCASLGACCEQLADRPRSACERVIEAAVDTACVEFAQRACPAAGDGGPPTPMSCEDVLECCAELEGREQIACEAAAAAPEGRACDRAIETYCR